MAVRLPGTTRSLQGRIRYPAPPPPSWGLSRERASRSLVDGSAPLAYSSALTVRKYGDPRSRASKAKVNQAIRALNMLASVVFHVDLQALGAATHSFILQGQPDLLQTLRTLHLKMILFPISRSKLLADPTYLLVALRAAEPDRRFWPHSFYRCLAQLVGTNDVDNVAFQSLIA